MGVANGKCNSWGGAGISEEAISIGYGIQVVIVFRLPSLVRPVSELQHPLGEPYRASSSARELIEVKQR